MISLRHPPRRSAHRRRPVGLRERSPRAATPRTIPAFNSVHQPVVQRSDFVIDLDASGDTLAASERARLAAWFDSIELRYGDRISVDEPRDYPAPGAREGVGSVLGEYGMLLQAGAPISPGAVAPGTVRVIASRSTASVPGCPNWREDRDRAPASTPRPITAAR